MKKYYVIRTLWFDINCWLAWVNKANWHLTITELKINEQQSKAYFIHLKGKGSCDDKSSKRRETFNFPNNGFSMLERERESVYAQNDNEAEDDDDDDERKGKC